MRNFIILTLIFFSSISVSSIYANTEKNIRVLGPASTGTLRVTNNWWDKTTLAAVNTTFQNTSALVINANPFLTIAPVLMDPRFGNDPRLLQALQIEYKETLKICPNHHSTVKICSNSSRSLHMQLNISDGIDIKVDFSFKKVFGNPQHSGLLINLLNGLFKTSHDTLIEQVTILNPSMDRDQLDDKACILDIRAITNQGEPINIEMQIINRHDWIERSLYYWSKLYEQQLQAGDNYSKLQRTVSISFLNFKLFERPRGLSIYQLRERDDHALLTPLMQLFFIELPKLPNPLTELDQDLKDWVMFMNATNSQQRDALAANNAYIQEAQRLLELIAQNPDERLRYESRLKGLRDYHSGLAAERKVSLEEGLQRGRQEALQQVALNMLSNGIALEIVSASTGLSVEAIKSLSY